MKLSNSDTNNFQIFKAKHQKNQRADAGQLDVKGLSLFLAGTHLGIRLPEHFVPPFHRCPESMALAKPNEQRGKRGKYGGYRHWEVD